MGCNYLSLPMIPTSNTQVLINQYKNIGKIDYGVMRMFGAHGSGHKGALVTVPGFTIKWYQNQETRQSNEPQSRHGMQDGWTDRPTDGVIPIYPTQLHCAGGIVTKNYTKDITSIVMGYSLWLLFNHFQEIHVMISNMWKLLMDAKLISDNQL